MKEILFIKRFSYNDGLNEVAVELPAGYEKSGDPIYAFTDSQIIIAQRCFLIEKPKDNSDAMKQAASVLLR